MQYGFDALSLMPTSLHGPGVNYHPTYSHALPALSRRFHGAHAPSITRWGIGFPLRELLHADDLGEACAFSLEHWQPGPDDHMHLAVGMGVDLTILELAEAVAAATGYQCEIHWDASKPDGTPKKQLNVNPLAVLGWRARIPLAEGLTSTVEEFAARGSKRL